MSNEAPGGKLLKGCPFCGGEAKQAIQRYLSGDPASVWVSCGACKFGLSVEIDYENSDGASEMCKAINTWNRRASRPEKGAAWCGPEMAAESFAKEARAQADVQCKTCGGIGTVVKAIPGFHSVPCPDCTTDRAQADVVGYGTDENGRKFLTVEDRARAGAGDSETMTRLLYEVRQTMDHVRFMREVAEAERDEWRAKCEKATADFHTIRPAADCYMAVCREFGLAGDVLGHIKRLTAAKEKAEADRDHWKGRARAGEGEG